MAPPHVRRRLRNSRSPNRGMVPPVSLAGRCRSSAPAAYRPGTLLGAHWSSPTLQSCGWELQRSPQRHHGFLQWPHLPGRRTVAGKRWSSRRSPRTSRREPFRSGVAELAAGLYHELCPMVPHHNGAGRRRGDQSGGYRPVCRASGNSRNLVRRILGANWPELLARSPTIHAPSSPPTACCSMRASCSSQPIWIQPVVAAAIRGRAVTYAAKRLRLGGDVPARKGDDPGWKRSAGRSPH